MSVNRISFGAAKDLEISAGTCSDQIVKCSTVMVLGIFLHGFPARTNQSTSQKGKEVETQDYYFTCHVYLSLPRTIRKPASRWCLLSCTSIVTIQRHTCLNNRKSVKQKYKEQACELCNCAERCVRQQSFRGCATAKRPNNQTQHPPRYYPSSLPRNISRGQQRNRQAHGATAVGWVMGPSPDAHSQLAGTSPGRFSRISGSSPLGTSLPIPQFQHPSHELLDKNGFQQMKYDKWRARCLEERAQSGENDNISECLTRHFVHLYSASARTTMLWSVWKCKKLKCDVFYCYRRGLK